MDFEFSHESIRKLEGIVLPAVMWVNLKHVGYPQAFERSVQRRNMLTIVRCDNRLSERSLEEPAFLYPIRLKGRIDTFEMRQKLLQDFLLAQLEEGIIHRSIVAKINEVLSTILRRRLVIGMLNQTGKRVTWIAWIDPIAIGKLASQGEDETLRTICLTPIITSTIIIWQRWYEAT